MGLFNMFKDVLGDTPLECRGYCPVYDCTTNQTKTGVMGQAKKLSVKNVARIVQRHTMENG